MIIMKVAGGVMVLRVCFAISAVLLSTTMALGSQTTGTQGFNIARAECSKTFGTLYLDTVTWAVVPYEELGISWSAWLTPKNEFSTWKPDQAVRVLDLLPRWRTEWLGKQKHIDDLMTSNPTVTPSCYEAAYWGCLLLVTEKEARKWNSEPEVLFLRLVNTTVFDLDPTKVQCLWSENPTTEENPEKVPVVLEPEKIPGPVLKLEQEPEILPQPNKPGVLIVIPVPFSEKEISITIETDLVKVRFWKELQRIIEENPTKAVAIGSILGIGIGYLALSKRMAVILPLIAATPTLEALGESMIRYCQSQEISCDEDALRLRQNSP